MFLSESARKYHEVIISLIHTQAYLRAWIMQIKRKSLVCQKANYVVELDRELTSYYKG